MLIKIHNNNVFFRVNGSLHNKRYKPQWDINKIIKVELSLP